SGAVLASVLLAVAAKLVDPSGADPMSGVTPPVSATQGLAGWVGATAPPRGCRSDERRRPARECDPGTGGLAVDHGHPRGRRNGCRPLHRAAVGEPRGITGAPAAGAPRRLLRQRSRAPVLCPP